MTAAAAQAHDGRLVANLMHFARTLSAAGLPVGPGKVLDAVAAVEAVGITDRRDFYWTLHAVFVNRRDQREIFDQACHIFWRTPDLLGKMMSLLLPQLEDPNREQQPEMIRRLAEALHQDRGSQPQAPNEDREDVEIDATMTFSEREILRTMDFEAMSREETARAEAAIRRLRLPLNEVPIRRWEPDPRGLRADMRATLRAAVRAQDLV